MIAVEKQAGTAERIAGATDSQAMSDSVLGQVVEESALPVASDKVSGQGANTTEPRPYAVVASGDGSAVKVPVDTEAPDRDTLSRLASMTGGYKPRGEWGHTAALWYRVAKRVFNVAFSAAVCAVGLAPGLVLAAVIAADTKGSPIYVSKRVGYRGREIGVLKFRSMVADAWDVEKYLSPEQLHQWRTEMKVDDDPRITRIGRFIRRTSIDEFPQFLNVLAGQMSVVGPRPIIRAELGWFGDDADRLLSCHPGITGLWQVVARNDATYEDGTRQRIELAYVDRRCLRLDLRIVLGTFGVMFGKRKTGR